VYGSSVARGQETTMARIQRRPTLFDPATYTIRVRGALAPTWSDQLGGMRITVTEAGDDAITELVGRLADQAALHGVLAGLYELGFPMLLVEYIPNLGDATNR
jgi:hypothetical protein